MKKNIKMIFTGFRYLIFICAIFGQLLLFYLWVSPTTAFAAPTTFKCLRTGTIYPQAAECYRNCQSPVSPKCAIILDCPDLKKDKQVIGMYNAVVFGASGGVVSPSMPGAPMPGMGLGAGRAITDRERRNFVDKILKVYYPGIAFSSIVFGEGAQEWADAQCTSGGKDCTLTVKRDLLSGPSLPFIISSLGHEIIHMKQKQRGLKENAAIDRAIVAFYELEASLWDTGAQGYTWDLPASKLIDCFTPPEVQEVRTTLEHREQQVRKAIDAAMNGPRSAVSATALERWLNDNKWTKEQWLPKNPNWKSYR